VDTTATTTPWRHGILGRVETKEATTWDGTRLCGNLRRPVLPHLPWVSPGSRALHPSPSTTTARPPEELTNA
jgi:hypothetical protein